MGEVSAEAAAGLYLQDRTAQLRVLHLLLQAQACSEAAPEDPASKALGQFNSLLLKCPPGAKSGALHALLDAAKVGSKGPPGRAVVRVGRGVQPTHEREQEAAQS